MHSHLRNPRRIYSKRPIGFEVLLALYSIYRNIILLSEIVTEADSDIGGVEFNSVLLTERKEIQLVLEPDITALEACPGTYLPTHLEPLEGVIFKKACRLSPIRSISQHVNFGIYTCIGGEREIVVQIELSGKIDRNIKAKNI